MTRGDAAPYRWRFFKSARCVQVKLETGADLAALPELDQRLWTVLSASTKGLRFDAATLRLLDADGDGRIRAPDVLAAVAWLRPRFRSLDVLFARKAEVSLADVDATTEEGKALLASFTRILAREDRADATVISLADVLGATALFNAQPFNGDGVVTPKSTADAALAAVVAQIAACEGATRDRSGDDGIDQAAADRFFADARAHLAWKAAGAKVAVLGEATAAAYAAYEAVAAEIDAYFTPPADLPLVAEDPTPVLPLTAGVNPLWAERFQTFADKAAGPVLGVAGVESITRADWAVVKAKFAPYGAWRAARAGAAVADVGDDRLAQLLAGGRVEAAVNDLLARDRALADESARFADCERALRFAAYLATWLRNYVNQANLYDTKGESVFRTGELYIDGRVCRLCFHVADEAAHAALAAKSKCCLLYAKLTRRAAGAARTVCAVVTAGSTAGLYVGRNGVFYDCDGQDWDAVVTRVVEAQVSLREAFWSPWAKIAAMIAEQCRKFLSSRQESAVAQVGGGVAAIAAPAPKPPDATALASSVAALGVGVGMAGAACAGLIGLVAGLPLWKVLAGVAAIILLVSLPSVALTWFRLRTRDLGAILNAGGWAVNRPLTFSVGLARTFTRRAPLPAGAAVARDPYARHGVLGCLLLVALLGAAAAGVCWRLHCGPFAETAESVPNVQEVK